MCEFIIDYDELHFNLSTQALTSHIYYPHLHISNKKCAAIARSKVYNKLYPSIDRITLIKGVLGGYVHTISY